MPNVMIHEEVGYFLSNKLNKNSYNFFLGLLAPDSPNTFWFGKKEDRWLAHQRRKDYNEWRNSLNEFYQKEKNNYDEDFLLGYYIHILTDIIYDDFLYLKVREEILKDNHSLEESHDIMRTDMDKYYFNEIEDIKDILNKDNVTYEINGISKELMSKWKEKIINELNNNNECIYINKEIIDTLNEESMEDVYLGIGTGKYAPMSVINIINKEIKTKEETLLEKIGNTKISTNIKNDIIVAGIDEVKVTLANCCKPVKGDEVIGYITKGSGIVVHRTNCHNIMDVDDRIIPIEWNSNSINKYKTSILVKLEKKDNVLVNLIAQASSSGITIESIKLINNSEYHTYNLVVLVENVDKLKHFLNNLHQMKEVVEVERLIQWE